MPTPLLLALLLALPALAQPTIDPDEPIKPTQSTPPQRALPSIPPVDAPGLSGTDFSLPVRRLYPEGTFLPSRPGRLIKARTGDVIFLPDSDGPPEPPMVLLAGQRLAQIDTAMAAPSFSGRAAIGGQVFVYRSSHYLLPTLFAPIAQPTEPAPASPETPAPPADADPRVEDLIKDLESRRAAPRVLAPQPPKPAEPTEPEPQADARPLLQEGTVLVFRRARIVRLPDHAGRIAVAFDNDPNSPAPPPMLIEPCAQLQRLESLAASRGESTPLKLSGRVLTYKGRNHLLPTFIQAASPSEVVPMQ